MANLTELMKIYGRGEDVIPSSLSNLAQTIAQLKMQEQARIQAQKDMEKRMALETMYKGYEPYVEQTVSAPPILPQQQQAYNIAEKQFPNITPQEIMTEQRLPTTEDIGQGIPIGFKQKPVASSFTFNPITNTYTPSVTTQGTPVTAKDKIIRSAIPESEVKKESNIIRGQNQITNYQRALNSDPRFKAFATQGVAFGAANDLIKLAKSGNQVAFKSLGTKMARAMGEVGVLTDSDVKRYIQAGSLTRKAGDTLSNWTRGISTEATVEDIQQIADVLSSNFDDKIKPIIDWHANQMAQGMNIPFEKAYVLIGGKTEATKQETQSKTQSTLPEGVTEDDITHTMQKYGMTRDQVLNRLKLGK